MILVSRSVKNAVGILIEISLNLYNRFGSTVVLTTLTFACPRARDIFPFADIFFNLLLQNAIVLQFFHFLG